MIIKRKKLKLIFFALFIFATAIVYAEEVFFIKNPGVKIYSAPSVKMKTVATLSKNQKVLKITESSKFYYIKTDNNITGWVYSFYLTKSSPAQADKSKSVIDALTTDNYASRTGSTTVNARGLTEMSQTYAKTRSISNITIQEAKDLENYKIADEELETFIMSGKLGEYSEE